MNEDDVEVIDVWEMLKSSTERRALMEWVRAREEDEIAGRGATLSATESPELVEAMFAFAREVIEITRANPHVEKTPNALVESILGRTATLFTAEDSSRLDLVDVGFGVYLALTFVLILNRECGGAGMERRA